MSLGLLQIGSMVWHPVFVQAGNISTYVLVHVGQVKLQLNEMR